MTYDMALGRVNSRWLAPSKKKMLTATGPFGLSDQTNLIAGKRSLSHSESYGKNKLTLFSAVNLSNVATRFGFSIWQRAKICIHINSKVRYQAIRKFRATAKMVKNSDTRTHISVNSLNFFLCKKGVGDTGDHWQVECSGDVWKRDFPVKFHHLDTDVYLSVSGRTFGRPINGQMEVIGVGNSYSATEWKTAEGLFIHPNAGKDKPVHTELWRRNQTNVFYLC